METLIQNSDSLKQQKIWTVIPNPFGFGNPLTPIGTIVEVFEEKCIREFEFFSFITPRSVMMVAEKQTGGIVATDFESLEEAIKDVPLHILRKQLDDQVHNANSAQMLSNEEFFKYYKL